MRQHRRGYEKDSAHASLDCLCRWASQHCNRKSVHDYKGHGWGNLAKEAGYNVNENPRGARLGNLFSQGWSNTFIPRFTSG